MMIINNIIKVGSKEKVKAVQTLFPPTNLYIILYYIILYDIKLYYIILYDIIWFLPHNK
jgi:hypothetical protein